MVNSRYGEIHSRKKRDSESQEFTFSLILVDRSDEITLRVFLSYHVYSLETLDTLEYVVFLTKGEVQKEKKTATGFGRQPGCP